MLHRWSVENDQACNKLATSFQLVCLVGCSLMSVCVSVSPLFISFRDGHGSLCWTRIQPAPPTSDPRPDPTRLCKNAMCYAAVCLQKQYGTTEALYRCSSNVQHTRNHISYKSWTQYTRYVVKVQSHESSQQTDTSFHAAVHQ